MCSLQAPKPDKASSSTTRKPAQCILTLSEYILPSDESIILARESFGIKGIIIYA